MSVQSVCGEHMSCACIGYLMCPEDESDILTKNNECVHNRQIEYEFVVVLLHTIYLMYI